MQKGCCSACDKPIVGQVITALGKTWHPEHFTCNHCNQELGTRNFFEREGAPYCEADYHNLFSPRCAYCNGPILDVNFEVHFEEFLEIFDILSSRNAWQRSTRLGTPNTSSAPSVASNSVTMASMNATANLTAATTTSTCSRQSAPAAIAPSWRITFQRSTASSIRIASCAE